MEYYLLRLIRFYEYFLLKSGTTFLEPVYGDLSIFLYIKKYKEIVNNIISKNYHRIDIILNISKKFFKKFTLFMFSLVLSIRSQLLYATCRPIYVVLTRLSEKQIDELKKDSSKYQCPQKSINVRKVLLMRRVGPACKTKSKKATCEQNVVISSKRKAPLGNELDPIIVEDEDAGINTTAKETLIAFTAVKSSLDNLETIKPIKEKKCPSSTIMLIDLCSSDEEENDQSSRTPCDENRDPMTTTDSPIAKTLLRKLTPKQTLREALHLPRTLIDRLVIEQRMERS